MSGLIADSRTMIDKARVEAQVGGVMLLILSDSILDNVQLKLELVQSSMPYWSYDQ